MLNNDKYIDHTRKHRHTKIVHAAHSSLCLKLKDWTFYFYFEQAIQMLVRFSIGWGDILLFHEFWQAYSKKE